MQGLASNLLNSIQGIILGSRTSPELALQMAIQTAGMQLDYAGAVKDRQQQVQVLRSASDGLRRCLDHLQQHMEQASMQQGVEELRMMMLKVSMASSEHCARCLGLHQMPYLPGRSRIGWVVEPNTAIPHFCVILV